LEIELLEYRSEGVARVGVNGEVEVWVLCQLRTPKRCPLCERLLLKGAGAWRPVGNQLHRGVRVCAAVCWTGPSGPPVQSGAG